MEQIHRILLVEDEFFDAELNIREIKKVLPGSKFEVVDNRSAYKNYLGNYIPDIIISDFNLPSFDGLSALKIALEVCPLTPFIMVTGSINEDTAVECMKAGATDYVLKDSLKRLGPSVLSALEQRKIKEERIEAFETIKLNEARYRYMFHNNPQPMLIYDVETLAILEVNEAAINHYGYSEMEFLGMTIKDLRPKDELEKLLNSLKTTDLNKSNQTGEWKHIKKSGEIIFVEVVAHSLIHNNRNARHVLINDITERKKAEEKLAQERKLLRTLIDNLPVTIYVKDTNGRKVISNRADQEVIGAKSEAEVIGKTDLETFNNEIGQRGYADDLVVINTGQAVINREEDFYDANGIQRWLITSKIPLSDENGQTLGLVGIGRDITDQKLAQDKILKLSKGIEQSTASIIITDIAGNIEYVNPSFVQATGYSEIEVIGKNPRIIKSGLMPPETYHDLWKTISMGGIWKGELLNKRKDGLTFWESVTLTSIKNDKGVITNYIAIKEDITERKQMELELIQAKEKAEESDRLKSAFLANMSHEIRTPLNSIVGFSELLGDPDFDAEQKAEFIRTIVDNGNSLLVIISDIMDFSMLEARQIIIRPERISCQKLMIDLLNDFSKKANQKGIELQMDESRIRDDIWFESDVYRIKQVFSNLIGNAIKFTAKGNITIGFKLEGEMLEFNVRDTGIGIPPEFHQAIFERFRQVDTARTRKYGGNGLGLAISKNLTELLGGTIWVDSQIGKYSDFKFTIPLKKY
jgi:hypothetical protein